MAAGTPASSAAVQEQKSVVENERGGLKTMLPLPWARHGPSFADTATNQEFHGGGWLQQLGEIRLASGRNETGLDR